MAQALRLAGRHGVLVSGVKPNSFADEAGLRRNVVLVSLDGHDIPGLKDYETLYREMVAGHRTDVLARVNRGRLVTFHVLKPVYDRDNQPAPVPQPAAAEPPK
jgi:S1-C subfamily serine protease